MITRRPVNHKVRHTDELQATHALVKGTDAWKKSMREAMRYPATFVTEEVAWADAFNEAAHHLVDMAIQGALNRVEQEQDCLMRYYSIHYTPVVLYHDEEQFVHFVGTIIVEPLPGETPISGPKRQYVRRK